MAQRTRFQALLPWLILLMSALYIFVIPADPHGVKLLFKIIPMLLIITYTFLHIPKNSKRFQWATLIGLVFCMFGDGLLDWFVVGLSAFLIGHLCYMTGFFSEWRFSAWRLASIVPIAIYAACMGTQLVQALQEDNDTGLIIPVICYITVIGLMAWSAIMTGRLWATIGSLLFLASDSILSWNLFVSDITYAGTLIMTTYYAAQYCIARNVTEDAKH
ncbi:putative membrane protein YhhN [Paenibacillus cellulosilyticus]|uniref:Putative membrane protein YhhN n=1 Tax=Paenibacillus cellulosilyticus TaxID=375489 RepID=A0A2V2Z2V3_9BACL|nr:lysoplasmalogenase [Paenibacillus cellulosilyticus]PWW08596.1 putative membrane protein YhhN [Paenibacillus cellulosilyticus]